MGVENTPSKERKLRVLHAVKNWLPSTENWCYRLVSEVPDVEVHIISEEFTPGSVWRNGFHNYRWPVSRFSNPNGIFALRLWNLFERLTHNLQARMVAHQLRGRVDLLHAHFAPVGWECIPLAKKLGVPLVVSFYGYDYDKLPNEEARWNSRYSSLFNAAASVLCEGANGIRLLSDRGCELGKLQISRLGVDVRTIPFPETHTRNIPFQILQLARLTEKKGHVDALRAVALASKNIDLEFTIVGSDADVRRNDLRDLASSLGIADKVKFVERIDYGALHSYLATFDVFLHPSKTARDLDCEGGAPVVFLDAQAVGLPVVSTLHCDIPDEVIDRRTGFLSPEGDIAGIAESLRQMATMDDATYEQFRREGRRHVQEFFDSTSNANDVGKFYAQAIAGQKHV